VTSYIPTQKDNQINFALPPKRIKNSTAEARKI